MRMPSLCFSTRTICVLFVMAASGCTTTQSSDDLCAGDPPLIDLSSEPLEPGVYDVATSERIHPEELWSRLADARFVVVGERHDDPWHHTIEYDLFQGVMRADDGTVFLGMEMFQRPYQPKLTRYIERKLDEEAMLSGVEREDRWGYSADFYAPLWREARRVGVSVIALDARSELTERVAKVGINGLSEDERVDLPELVFDGTGQREWFREAFAQHDTKTDEATFGHVYQVQVVRAETMAERAVRVMAEGLSQKVSGGNGHDVSVEKRVKNRLSHTLV